MSYVTGVKISSVFAKFLLKMQKTKRHGLQFAGIKFNAPGLNAVDFAMKLHSFCERRNLKYSYVAFDNDNVTVIGLRYLPRESV
jgi:hypothetical protein